MDGLEHDSLGKLAVSFCNPLKEDTRRERSGKVDPRQVASATSCFTCHCSLVSVLQFGSEHRSQIRS